MSELLGFRVIESALVPYGQVIVIQKGRWLVISTAPKPTRWARLRAWLRKIVRRWTLSEETP